MSMIISTDSEIKGPILWVAVATAFTLFGDSILYSVLPIYAESLGIPLVAVGVLLSINRWVRLITNPLAGKIFQKIGARKPLLLSAIVGVLVIFIYAQGKGLILFILARILWGLCWSHLRLGNYLIAIGKIKNNFGRVMGSMNAIRRLGSTFIVLFGGYLIDKTGYRPGMTVIAFLALLAIPVMYRVIRNIDNKIGQSISGEKQRKNIDNSDNNEELSRYLCYLSTFINGFIRAFVVATLALVLEKRVGTSVRFLGLNFGITTLTGIFLAVRYSNNILFSPVAGIISDLWGRKKVFFGSSLLLIISLLIFALITSPLLTVILVCIILFTTTAQKMTVDAAIAENTGNQGDAPILLSIFSSFRDLGSACGPLIGYIVGVYINFNIVYLLGVLALAIVLGFEIFDVFSLLQEKQLSNLYYKMKK